MGTVTASELLTIAQGHAEFLGQSFDRPDEDWLPSALAVQEDEKRLIVMLIDPAMLENVESKDQLTMMLAGTVLEKRISAIYTAFSAYTISMRREDLDHPEVRPEDLPDDFSTHPDAREILVLSSVTAEESLCSISHIQRSDDRPPTLSEWQTDGNYSGRFAEPLRNALKIARRKREEEA